MHPHYAALAELSKSLLTVAMVAAPAATTRRSILVRRSHTVVDSDCIVKP